MIEASGIKRAPLALPERWEQMATLLLAQHWGQKLAQHYFLEWGL